MFPHRDFVEVGYCVWVGVLYSFVVWEISIFCIRGRGGGKGPREGAMSLRMYRFFLNFAYMTLNECLPRRKLSHKVNFHLRFPHTRFLLTHPIGLWFPVQLQGSCQTDWIRFVFMTNWLNSFCFYDKLIEFVLFLWQTDWIRFVFTVKMRH